MIPEPSVPSELVPTASTGSFGAPSPASLSAGHGSYLLGLLGGLIFSLLVFLAVLLMLQRSGNLPPPAFANSLCLDEKLNFMRAHRVDAPELLVVGSSVAWRHFDGSVVDPAGGAGTKALNGGFCGLHINQSVYMANWLPDRHPTVRQVLLIAAPQDFALCHARRTDVVNRKDVDSFVFGGALRWPYYLRYFAPASLTENARRIKERRTDPGAMDALVFDRFASGPLDTTLTRSTLYYGAPEALDPGCFEALRGLARRLEAEGRSFKVVTTPLHPDWKTQMDPQRHFLDDFDRRLTAALHPHNAQYWNSDKELEIPRAAFTDAIHLRWSAVPGFTSAMAHKLHLQKRPAG